MAGTYTGKRIAFIGDVHAFSGYSNYQSMITDYIQTNKMMDDIFILGDITYDAAEDEFQVIADWSDRWPATVHMLMGNHDLRNKYLDDEAERSLYKERFKNICHEKDTNYVVTIGNCVFICISTDGTTLADKEDTTYGSHRPGDGFMTNDTKNYLLNKLSYYQNKNVNIIVCSHQPPYDVNQWATERKGNIYYNAEELINVLSSYRIDAWFYAHCHQSYKNGVVDISEPYTGTAPEYKQINITSNTPRSAAPRKVNNIYFIPCWGGNHFYGCPTTESRYIELHNGSNSFTVRSRHHEKGIWQKQLPNLDVVVPLSYTISV